MSGGGLWNDYGACELENHDTLLLECQQHRMVVYLKSKNGTQKDILSQYTSLLAQLVFVPFPLASSCQMELMFAILGGQEAVQAAAEEGVKNLCEQCKHGVTTKSIYMSALDF